MVVADTHALVWWMLDPPQLSPAARAALDRGPVCVPVISCMEVAVLARRGRVVLPAHVSDWLDTVLSAPNVVLLPLTVDVAVTAGTLRDPIRDPADRLIVATALHQQVPLVTKDQSIRAANVVPTIW